MCWRVVSSNGETEWLRVLKWRYWRVVRNVCSTAMPMAPPRLRVTLISAEAEPLSPVAMPATESAASGASTSA